MLRGFHSVKLSTIFHVSSEMFLRCEEIFHLSRFSFFRQVDET